MEREDHLLLKKIEAIHKVNKEIIERIKKKDLVIIKRSYVLVRDEELTLKVNEMVEELDAKEVVLKWNPNIFLTPIEDLFNDKIVYVCPNFDHLEYLNNELFKVAFKYRKFGGSQEAIEDIKLFLKNYELIQVSLGSLESGLFDAPSNVDKFTEKISLINELTSTLVEEANVSGTKADAWNDPNIKYKKTNHYLNQNSKPRELTFKIVLIGDTKTGKTSYIKRLVHGLFSQTQRVTIGVDFALKIWNNDSTTVNAQLWDISGLESNGNMTRVYFKEVLGAIIFCDVTRPSTFQAARLWKRDLKNKSSFLETEESVPTILVVNKCDADSTLPLEIINNLNSLCAEEGIGGWISSSAKDNIGINESFSAIMKKVLDKWDFKDNDFYHEI